MKKIKDMEIYQLPERIYHYTSIETLALILKNQTLRFNRLDKVDDPEEYALAETFKNTESLEKTTINPTEYLYVSCWTSKASEILFQWNNYAENGHGVRVGIPAVLLKKYLYNLLKSNELYSKSDGFPDYIIYNLTDDSFFSHMNYDDNVRSFDTNIFGSYNGMPCFNFKNIGFIKNKKWEIQEEYRFKILAFPKEIEAIPIIPGECYAIDPEKKVGKLRSYIDLSLTEDIIRNIQILIGPNATKIEYDQVRNLSEVFHFKVLPRTYCL